MCTLSFIRLRQGYSLMFNRDESPLREPASSLAGLADDHGQPQGLFPLDPPSQGSFIGVNRSGAAFALLNQHPRAYVPKPQTRSRGRLVPLALQAASAIAGLERVATLDLSETAPFLLLGFDEGEQPVSLRWDGATLQRRLHDDGALQVSSSSQLEDQALGFRRRAFDAVLEALTPDDEPAVLASQQGYHLSEAPDPGPLAVWMTREDACTVSFSHVLVRPGQVTLRHWLRADREAAREPWQHSLAREAPKRA